MLRITVSLLCALVVVSPATAGDVLFEEFQSPPAKYRPFVRWWWNGSYITEAEVLRELDVMKAAGIGGVEINTIGMPDGVSPESLEGLKALPWLSPEWSRMVQVAAGGARQRGMVPDLIVGSGWPFGGRFLEGDERTQKVSLVKTVLVGPTRFEGSVAGLSAERERRRDEVEVDAELVFLRLVPSGLSAFEPGAELGETVGGDGSFVVDVPEGEHTLYVGLLEIGFTHVKLGAPGADGPVVNHFDAAAVRKYLDHMSSELGPRLGGQLGDAVRALFVDSLELDHANWTADLPEQFLARRGYELAPYLPFVLDWDAFGEGTPRADTVRRARYDFVKTLVELFHERFLTTYIAWCHDNGVMGRIQAYGRETHPLEGSMLVDLPEGESWFWAGHDWVIVNPTVVNKYVASGARLSGKKLVSFEAMTNAVPAFRANMEDLKVGMDQSILTGAVHPILHGFNYSPPEVGFPGWVRFATYFSEQNPWWRHFPLFTEYAARLTTVFAQTVGQARIAVLGPRADEWSHDGMLYQPFPEVARPWYHYALWQAFEQNGCGTDFVSERILQEATLRGGRLEFGPRSYEALVVQDAESLEPETARAIERFAASGGKVLFVGRTPSRSPGLEDAAARDRLVQDAIAGALAANPRHVAMLPAPLPGDLDGADRSGHMRNGMPVDPARTLVHWAREALLRFDIQPTVEVANPHEAVSVVHHVGGQRDLFFLANRSRVESVLLTARFRVGDKAPWRWDPQTGQRAPIPQSSAEEPLELELGPAESMLLVFEPGGDIGEPAPPAPRPSVDSQVVTGPWEAELQHVDSNLSSQLTLDQVNDLRLSGDPALSAFAGTAVYRRSLEPGERSFLDLGEVHGVSEVVLNGESLGVRWWGNHLYDLAPALRDGANDLEVRVTTMLANYCRSLRENPVAMRWCSWYPAIPAGLVGPVKLIKPDDD